VSSVVMAFGTIALIIAEYTPFFQWIGVPFIPILDWMQLPDAAEASQTILIGFSDMFMTAVIGSYIDADITRCSSVSVSVCLVVFQFVLILFVLLSHRYLFLNLFIYQFLGD